MSRFASPSRRYERRTEMETTCPCASSSSPPSSSLAIVFKAGMARGTILASVAPQFAWRSKPGARSRGARQYRDSHSGEDVSDDPSSLFRYVRKLWVREEIEEICGKPQSPSDNVWRGSGISERRAPVRTVAHRVVLREILQVASLHCRKVFYLRYVPMARFRVHVKFRVQDRCAYTN